MYGQNQRCFVTQKLLLELRISVNQLYSLEKLNNQSMIDIW